MTRLDSLKQYYLPFGPPILTRAGFKAGARLSIPYIPGTIIFAMTSAALAEKAGLSLGQALAINGVVYAGAAQMVAYTQWVDAWTIPHLLAVMLLVMIVNSRMILMGASLYPYFQHLPARASFSMMFFNTDLNWLLFLKHAQERKDDGRVPDIGLHLGFAVPLWFVWTFSTWPGWLAGAQLGDLRTYGLDLFVVVFFISFLVPMWKGVRFARPWLVAGAVALLIYALLPGSYYIIIGALSGAVAGAVMKP